MLKRIRWALAALVPAGVTAGAPTAAAARTHRHDWDGVHYRQIANLTGPGVPGGPPFGLVSDIVWVDPASHRVLLSDDSNTFGGITGQVDAWSTFSNAFVGGMSGGFTGLTGFPASFDQLGPDGLLVDTLGRIWAGNGDGIVHVGNVSTMAQIGLVTTGSTHRADELADDPVDQRVLVTNPSDSPPFLTVMGDKPTRPGHTPSFPVLAHVSLGTGIPTDSLEQPKWDPISGNYLVSVRQVFDGDTNGEVAVVNPRTFAVGKPFPVPVNCNPTGMALGPGLDMLLGCDSAPPQIMDRVTGTIDPINWGSFTPSCCADEVWYNPGDNRYYVADFGNPGGLGTNPVVTVIDAWDRTVVAEIPIRNSSGQPDPAFHAVAADPFTNKVYVPTSEGVQVFAASDDGHH
jgi:hypothetical protein